MSLTRAPRPLLSVAFAIAIPLVIFAALTYGHATMAAASSLLLVRITRRWAA